MQVGGADVPAAVPAAVPLELELSEDKKKAFDKGFRTKNLFLEKKRKAALRKKREQEEAAREYEKMLQYFAADNDQPTENMFVRGGSIGGPVPSPKRRRTKKPTGASSAHSKNAGLSAFFGTGDDDDDDDRPKGLGFSGRSSAKSTGPPSFVSSSSKAPAFVSSSSKAPAFVSSSSKAPAFVSSSSKAPAFVGASSSSSSSSSPKAKTSVFDKLATSTSPSNASRKRRKTKDKKREIDAFMEELKQQKAMSGGKFAAPSAPLLAMPRAPVKGSFDIGDPNTTNIYVGNLHPYVTEQKLFDLFSQFGGIGSVKVMWPRNEEEFNKRKNCGFVSFMKRPDAADCIADMQGHMIYGFPLKLGWGKAVSLPAQALPGPVNNIVGGGGRWSTMFPHASIPPHLNVVPPPSQGGPIVPTLPGQLPPNPEPPAAPDPVQEVKPAAAEAPETRGADVALPADSERIEVKVPSDRTQHKVIDCMAAYAADFGPVFERLIMERESSRRSRYGYVPEPPQNDDDKKSDDKSHSRSSSSRSRDKRTKEMSQFDFLFDPSSDDHKYYRWRVYSLAQGDTLEKWRTAPFQMLLGGPFWVPPPVPPTREERRRQRERERAQRQKERERKRSDRGDDDRDARRRRRREKSRKLRSKDRDMFEDMLRDMTSDRNRVKNAMGFALDHAEEAKDVVQLLAESLTIKETPIPKKIARLYVVSDILYNTNAQVKNASAYRSELQAKLPDIFKSLHTTYATISGRITANAMKEKILMVLRVWQAWNLFPHTFCGEMEDIFLGKNRAAIQAVISMKASKPQSILAAVHGVGTFDSDSDGKGDDVDGVPLDAPDGGDDVDGVPMDEEEEKADQMIQKRGKSTFVAVEEPAPAAAPAPAADDDIDGAPLDDDDDVDGVPMDDGADDDDDVDGVPLTP